MPEQQQQFILIDPKTGDASGFNKDQYQGALNAGFWVPLVDAEGQATSFPYEEAQKLVKSGQYRQPSPLQLQDMLKATKYGTPAQQAGAFIEGALSGLAGPLAPMAESAVGIPAEDIASRKEVNPGSFLAGEMAGMVGGTLVLPQASLPGVAARAGKAAASAIALKGATGKIAQAAAQGAIEGAIYGASNQLSEAIIGNPKDVSENFISHIGLSAALGAGFNLALAPIAMAASQASKKSTGFISKIRSQIDPTSEPRPFAAQLDDMGIDAAERKTIEEGLKTPAHNLKEVDEAAKRRGVDLLEMHRSGSSTIRTMQATQAKDLSSFAGIETQQRIDKYFSQLSRNMDEAMGAPLGKSRAQVGEELKEGLIKSIEDAAKPIDDIYNSVKEVGGDVYLRPQSLKRISKNILKIEGLLSSTGKPISEGSAQYKFAKRVSDELATNHLNTANELRLYRQSISNDIKGQPELQYIGGRILDKLDDAFDSSVLKAADSFKESSPYRQKFEQLVDNYALAKKTYAEFREQLDTLGGALNKKIRKGEGAQAFVDWLSKEPAEKVSEKLFTKNNYKFLEFLSKKFPEQAELLSSFKRSEIRDAALEKSFQGMMSPTVALKKINELEPEIKKFLFSDKSIKQIDDVKLLLSNNPPDANPSNTARAWNFLDWLRVGSSPSALRDEGIALLKKKLIKDAVKFSPREAPLMNALIKAHELQLKSIKRLEQGAAGIFSEFESQSGEAADVITGGKLGYGAQRIRENKKKEKERKEKYKKGYAEGGVVDVAPSLHSIRDKAQRFGNDPQLLLNHLSQATGQIGDLLPDTAMGLSMDIANAVSFLNSKVPVSGRMAPLDPETPVSKSDIAQFNRYASVADDPYSVFGHIKEGTLTLDHIEGLASMYPATYEKMKFAALDKMAGFLAKNKPWQIPYKTRLGLSLFLGQNLDSSMSQQSILSNQMALQNAQKQAALESAMTQQKFSKSGVGKMKISDEQTKAQQAIDRRASQRSA